MVIYWKDFGMVKYWMDMENKHGQMVNIMKAILKIVKDMEKENYYLMMAHIMKDNLNQMKLLVKVLTLGRMVLNIKDL